MKNINKITIILCILSILMSSLSIMNYLNFDKQINMQEKDFNCSNLSVKETSYCLVNYVSTFYNYTLRKDTDKTLEDIKLNGGDCYDYSNLYKKLAEELGYHAKVYSFFNESIGHSFTIIYDENMTAYCHVSLLNVRCWDFT